MFVRVTRDLSKQMSSALLRWRRGRWKLRVDNPSGDELHEEDFYPAPFLGLTFTRAALIRSGGRPAVWTSRSWIGAR